MKFLWVLLILVFIFLFPIKANAKSEYVLPYPSFMPGNPLYKINLIKDEILKFWYFGNFGEFKYNLKQSDKYLVEAKTLFEYKQYLLGVNALKKSDNYFRQTSPALLKAKDEGNDINQNLSILKSAGEKHVEILNSLENEIPETFVWEPEKMKPTELNLNDLLQNSISIRKSI